VILGLGGNIIGFLFSLLGGIFAWCTMCLLADRKNVSIFGVSIAGAAAHGLGQILAALWVMRTVYVISYLPYLVLAGSLAGALIAFLTIPIVKALDHIGSEMIQ
jgi:heptaprenyl diphosphate synthase